MLCDAPLHNLRTALAIALRREAVGSNAVGDEVVDNALCAALREAFVVLVIATIVAVGAEFDGHVGVLIQECHEAVEGGRAALGEGGAIKLIEHIAYQHWRADGSQGEL